MHAFNLLLTVFNKSLQQIRCSFGYLQDIIRFALSLRIVFDK